MIETIARKYRNWETHRETREELGSLSTRGLRDRGVGRTDIRFVARSR